VVLDSTIVTVSTPANAGLSQVALPCRDLTFRYQVVKFKGPNEAIRIGMLIIKR
jgi:hypothetical protein